MISVPLRRLRPAARPTSLRISLLHIYCSQVSCKRAAPIVFPYHHHHYRPLSSACPDAATVFDMEAFGLKLDSMVPRAVPDAKPIRVEPKPKEQQQTLDPASDIPAFEAALYEHSDASQTWIHFQKLFLRNGKGAANKKYLLRHVQNLTVLLSGKLPLEENPKDAVKTILEAVGLFTVESHFLRAWLYSLIYRHNLPLPAVWNLLQSMDPSSGAVQHRLSDSCIQFLFEAHHRLHPYSSTLPYVFQYLSKNNIQLTPALAECLMHECAAFSNINAARKIMYLLESNNQVPTLVTYEWFVVCSTRHIGLQETSQEELLHILTSMKENGVAPTARIYHSLFRWASNWETDGVGVIDFTWLDKMVEDGIVPSLATATILVQLYLKKCASEANYIVESSVRSRLDTVFEGVRSGVLGQNITANSPETQMTVGKMMDQFIELVFEFSSSHESSAAVVVLITYLLSQKDVERAVSMLPKIRALPMKQSSRVYGELLRGAVLASREDLVQTISDAMIAEEIVPDRYIYHQLIKADFERGKFKDGLTLLDSLLSMEDVRSDLLVLDDYILADLITDLGKMGEYEMIFHIYSRFKKRGGGFSMGPRATSKVLSFSAPIIGENDAKFPAFDHNEDNDQIEPTTLFPSSQRYPSRRKSSFYAPVSSLEIISDYATQPGAHIDSALCSAAISSIIRSKLPPAILPEIIKKFDANGMTLTPYLLCFTAEAFASIRNLEGIEWVIRILNETRFDIEMTSTVEKNVWRRIWMANLTAAAKLGNVEAVESAIRGLCYACMPKHIKYAPGNGGGKLMAATTSKTFGIDLDVLSDVDRSRIMRALDGLLEAKARVKDVYGVRSLLVMMRDQDATPSVRSLRTLYFKGLQHHVDLIMGEGWLRKTVSVPQSDSGI